MYSYGKIISGESEIVTRQKREPMREYGNDFRKLIHKAPITFLTPLPLLPLTG